MTDEHFSRVYQQKHKAVIKGMCEKHCGELMYVWDDLVPLQFMPDYADAHMNGLAFWHPQLLTNECHRQDLGRAWDEYIRASRRGKGGPSREDFYNIAKQTPSSIWAVGQDQRLLGARDGCVCGILETRFFSLEALIWEYCEYCSLKDIYTFFFASSPSSP